MKMKEPENFVQMSTCKRDVEARDETETFGFQSETRPRPRPSLTLPRPRRDRDVRKIRIETVSRPRRRDRDYNSVVMLRFRTVLMQPLSWVLTVT